MGIGRAAQGGVWGNC